LRSLTRQVRYLCFTAADAPDGVPRLQAIIALTYADLCMANQMGHLRRTVRRLVAELERQILPDGGHISRNPGAVIELLLDLLPLRQAFGARNIVPPSALLNAIDRMMPMLRFFRHGDGSFARFNGMGPSSPDLFATLLAYDDARGAALTHAPHSGYQRVDIADLVLLMDTGRPPPLMVSQEAHAGCLSFELSCKQQPIIVNCGLPTTSRENWREVARGTAAHSTVVFNDRSSCQFLESVAFKRLLFGTPMVGGPKTINVAREKHAEAVMLRVSHDAYARPYGIIHQRTLVIGAEGNRIEGEELFSPADGDKLPRGVPDEFAARFHLHPSIKASRLTDGHGVMLMMPNKDVWTFNAYEDHCELEESVYLAGPDGPRRTVQIVIYGRASKVLRVHWSLVRAAPPATALANTRRGRVEEPQLPL
jgi:uncharacterized heparinase superfamily protein